MKDNTEKELNELRKRIKELEKYELEYKEYEKEIIKERDLAEKYFDFAEVIMVVLDKNQKVTKINKKGCTVLEYTKDNIIGKNWFKNFIPKSIRNEVMNAFNSLIIGEIDKIEYFENTVLTKSGAERLIAWHNTYLIDDKGNIISVLSSGDDITDIEKREEIISRQTEEILELSTPVLEMLKSVVVAPLIGTIDSERTQRFMERFLSRIVETGSPVALMDITGVPTLDTQTAQHLIEAITAATLLGTKVIVTGVRPAIAQTLVHLGIDLSDIVTKSSLSAGLRVALDYLNMEIVDKKAANKEDK